MSPNEKHIIILGVWASEFALGSHFGPIIFACVVVNFSNVVHWVSSPLSQRIWISWVLHLEREIGGLLSISGTLFSDNVVGVVFGIVWPCCIMSWHLLVLLLKCYMAMGHQHLTVDEHVAADEWVVADE